MFKKLIILAIFAFVGCSSDDCKPCEALYYNPDLDKYHRESTTECDTVVPKGYHFIKCLTIDY